jgi:hypothetical protein
MFRPTLAIIRQFFSTMKKYFTCTNILYPCVFIETTRSVVSRNNFSKMFIHIYLQLLHVSALVGHP